MRDARPTRKRASGGFTLLEILIAMALLALLAGVVTPAAGSIMRSRRTRATMEEMDLLADAILEFYRDTRQFPSEPLDILDAGFPGWSGPYLRGSGDDAWSGQSGYVVDGFGNAYDFTDSGFELTITSDGPDRANGTADDIELAVSVEPMLREMTLQELRILNAAVVRYNQANLGSSPLSGNWSVALSTLESEGYLPAGAGYEVDEWGSAYTGNPPGAAPLTEVVSPNIP